MELYEQRQYHCGSRVHENYLCAVRELPRIAAQLEWTWEPKQCRLPDWGSEHFTSLIKRFLTSAADSRVVFVGDSISQEHWSSMRCLLGKHVHSEEVTEIARLSGLSVEDLTGIQAFVTVGNTSVLYARHDYLVNKDLSLAGTTSSFWDRRRRALAQHRNSSHYLARPEVVSDISLAAAENFKEGRWDPIEYSVPFMQLLGGQGVYLVLNTGPHWHGMLNNYSVMVRNVLDWLQVNFRGRRVFYRANAHGHAECAAHSAPLSLEEELGPQRYWYGWRLFRQDSSTPHAKRNTNDTCAAELSPNCVMTVSAAQASKHHMAGRNFQP